MRRADLHIRISTNLYFRLLRIKQRYGFASMTQMIQTLLTFFCNRVETKPDRYDDSEEAEETIKDMFAEMSDWEQEHRTYGER